MIDRLLKFSEAADQLGVSVRTVDRMTAEGQIDLVHVRMARRVRQSDVTQIITKGATTDTGAAVA